MKKLLSIMIAVIFVIGVGCAQLQITKADFPTEKYGVLKEGAPLAKEKQALDIYCIAIGNFYRNKAEHNQQLVAYWINVLSGLFQFGYLGDNYKKVVVEILKEEPQADHYIGGFDKELYTYVLIEHPIHGQILTLGIYMEQQLEAKNG